MILKSVPYKTSSIKEGRFYLERVLGKDDAWFLFKVDGRIFCRPFTYWEDSYKDMFLKAKSEFPWKHQTSSLLDDEDRGRVGLYEIVENKFYIDL